MEQSSAAFEVTAAPDDVPANLARLRFALEEEVAAKALDRNLQIATLNVRAFGELTDKW